ncbi:MULTISPECIES: PTS system mannose/fructose/sorbose family transporter subunit IID [Eubacterium]|uniref:PTS system N-acetylgalactosamine-specific EIID component, Man family n=1 Tax=Eubacterium barkeri TaxID=1528 RepID=A0A1H3JD32_EUBBA|nr:PTS system mannose/fructose/sorbose family transporter subunit IID [Eubacterium barkeri]SDY37883.1 PTS system N-acetylgalactosamine-specific EIID component, Man family [Eubacterium barkeri]
MESNTVDTLEKYDDPKPEKVITKKDLNKMTWRSLLLQASFNYERMQACGWLYGIMSGLKKIHKNKKDLSTSMRDHMEFFNTHPFLVTFIMGLVLAMEENKEDRETIRAVKVATMGPLGGIGDALFWLTALPICAGIGASMAINGNIAGPFVFLILFNAIHFGLLFFLSHYGYNTGVKAIASLKEQTKKISHAATIVGLMVVGGLIASMVNLKTVMNIGGVDIQTGLLDAIMPGMLGLGYTFLMYYFLKKGASPILLIAITVGGALVLSLITQLTGFAII